MNARRLCFSKEYTRYTRCVVHKNDKVSMFFVSNASQYVCCWMHYMNPLFINFKEVSIKDLGVDPLMWLLFPNEEKSSWHTLIGEKEKVSTNLNLTCACSSTMTIEEIFLLFSSILTFVWFQKLAKEKVRQILIFEKATYATSLFR